MYSFPTTRRPRFLTEREYREWQMSLRRDRRPGWLTRLASALHRRR